MRQTCPAPTSPTTSRAPRLQKPITVLVLIVGLALSVPAEVFSARHVIALETDLLDASRAADLNLCATRGKYSGRDFISADGPLSPWIHGSWAASGPDDVASVFRWKGLLPALLTNLIFWLTLATTGAPLSWRAPAFFLWLAIWTNFRLMPMLGLLAVIICGYVLETARGWRWIGAILLWALAGPVLMAYYFALGLFVFAALLISVLVAGASTWGLSAADGRSRRRRVWSAGAATFGGAVLVGVMAYSSLTFRAYLRGSWEVTTGSWQSMAGPVEARYLFTVALTLLASIILAVWSCARWRSATHDEPLSRGRALSLLNGDCFCIVTVRLAVTGANDNHWVYFTLGLLVCLAGCFLPCYLRASHPRAIWPALLVWGPAAVLTSWRLLDLPAGQINAVRQWDPRYAALDITHPVIREAVDMASSLPEDALYVWPFESVVGSIAGKSNPGYTMQAYTAYTPYLEYQTIDRLRRLPHVPIIYFVNTYPLGEVEHLTRSPRIFRYLLENYAISAPRHAEFLLLRRHVGREQQWQEDELLRPEVRYVPAHDAPLRIDLPAAKAEACSASDLIVLRLNAVHHAPSLWRKPGHCFVTLVLSNGERRDRRILIPSDGSESDVIVSACSAAEPTFWSFFHPERLWRCSTRVVAVELRWEPIDRLSQPPAEINFHGISTLRRGGAEVNITGLSQAQDPDLWNWCYGDHSDQEASSP